MSSIVPKFRATVSETLDLQFDNIRALKQYLLKYRGKPVTVTVKKFSKGRSDNQNAYYWGVVLQLLSEHTGHETEELHALCKRMFLRHPTETRFEITRSTSSLTAAEMEEYLAAIRQWASRELSVYIPLPNEAEGHF